MTFTIRVVGRPTPKGSGTAILSPGGKPIVIDASSKHLRPWQKAVSTASRMQANGRPRLEGAVAVILAFYMPRPKHLGPLRRDVPHTGRPDVDKLARAVLDPLTGGIWADDAAVADLHSTKRYANPGEEPGCLILARSLVAAEPTLDL